MVPTPPCRQPLPVGRPANPCTVSCQDGAYADMTELYRPAWEGGWRSALRTLGALGTNETTRQGVVGGTASGTDWGLVKAA